MFKYYGSKYSLVGCYPPPLHDTIVEPFAGSAAYAVRWGTGRRVVLIERDEQVVELWRRLLAMTPAEICAIPVPEVGEMSSELLVAMSAANTTRTTPDSFVVSSRMAARFRSMMVRVAATVDRCRHFEIVCGDYRDAPDIEATWFIDPPYEYRGGRWDRTGGGRYLWANRFIDYDELGVWCRSRRGQTIVCEQDGAAWLPFDRHIDTMDSACQPYREVWWSNIAAGQLDLFAAQ